MLTLTTTSLYKSDYSIFPTFSYESLEKYGIPFERPPTFQESEILPLAD